MRILIDADACPVVRITERVAKEKGAYGIHKSGKWYTNGNVDRMLIERHMTKKARNAKKKHHLKGPAKRTAEDDGEQDFNPVIGSVNLRLHPQTFPALLR